MNGKKIVAQAVGAALAAVAVWLIQTFAKIPVPAEIAVAFGTLFSVGVSIVTPDEKEEG